MASGRPGSAQRPRAAATAAFSPDARAARRARAAPLRAATGRAAGGGAVASPRPLGSSLARRGAPPAARSPLPPARVLTREQKQDEISAVTRLLLDSAMVAAVRRERLPSRHLERLRRSLPEGAQLRVVKNSLLVQAGRRARRGWGQLKDIAKGANAYVFARDDAVKGCLRVLEEVERAVSDDLPPDLAPEELDARRLETLGAVYGGVYLTKRQFLDVKDLPDKDEAALRLFQVLLGPGRDLVNAVDAPGAGAHALVGALCGPEAGLLGTLGAAAQRG